MGASGWTYHTTWNEDPEQALQALRAEVFASGNYDKFWQTYGFSDQQPTTIDEALELAETEGTHSILDITTVGAGFGGAQPMPEELLVELLGTATPTREQAMAMASTLMRDLLRWQAWIVPTYEGDQPTGLLFVGVSGD